VDGSHFRLWRTRGAAPFTVGASDEPTVLVGVEGKGHLDYDGARCHLDKGATLLLPAVVGESRFHPAGAATVLEIRIADRP
jgi:mannose-6-phosphate isomerase class I